MTDKWLRIRKSWTLARAVAVGAGFGVLNFVVNMLWPAFFTRAPINLREEVWFGAVSAVGGAIIAFVLYFTKPFRKRGMVQHYLSWILAAVVAAFVLVFPDTLREGWSGALAFALWAGLSVGLGLGAFSRGVERRAAEQ